MPLSRSAIVYIGVGLVAIAAVAVLALRDPSGEGEAAGPTVNYSAYQQMLEGDMKKLQFHKVAKPVSALPFTTDAGGEATLADYKGRFVLLNFWATWCAPCRKEMPMLSELQAEFGGDDFEVLTLATGRNAVPAMKAFFAEISVDNLPLHRDPKQALAREMGVLGLPITVLLDPEGREIARMQGDAEWNSESAKAMIAKLITPDGS
ncbi:TlpA family protein disulfide reductase [Roseovarius pelagicus]|uniref:TlpA family protein disulfide reductase n=1 Tax=Roseovarius pelagicus TaxID=2980108 RepID=A0ABY6DIE1_9RHOB|nr:TlpA disulfide reductase family protein [Roseovarius pelagicus]UXX85023.1 TlpA family protein disulfide reductase [Roseovarius pelagicus]